MLPLPRVYLATGPARGGVAAPHEKLSSPQPNHPLDKPKNSARIVVMPASKLKPEDVAEIVDGANVFELASRFGVSADVIWDWGRRRGVKLESQDRSYASLDYSIPGAVLARRLGISRQRVGQLKARWGAGVVSCSIGFWEREEALALGLVRHGVAVDSLAPELRRHILEPADSCVGSVKADVAGVTGRGIGIEDAEGTLSDIGSFLGLSEVELGEIEERVAEVHAGGGEDESKWLSGDYSMSELLDGEDVDPEIENADVVGGWGL